MWNQQLLNFGVESAAACNGKRKKRKKLFFLPFFPLLVSNFFLLPAFLWEPTGSQKKGKTGSNFIPPQTRICALCSFPSPKIVKKRAFISSSIQTVHQRAELHFWFKIAIVEKETYHERLMEPRRNLPSFPIFFMGMSPKGSHSPQQGRTFSTKISFLLPRRKRKRESFSSPTPPLLLPPPPRKGVTKRRGVGGLRKRKWERGRESSAVQQALCVCAPISTKSFSFLFFCPPPHQTGSSL